MEIKNPFKEGFKMREKILIGTTLVSKYAYILDKFLKNQKAIQDEFSSSSLVIATDELNFLQRLEEKIKCYKIDGSAIYYQTIKPSYARDRTWSISAGREAIRQYALDNDFDYLLSVDADMIYETSIVQTLLKELGSFDVIQSGYKNRLINNIGFGLSCTLINREILEKIQFRCMEFKNGHVLEDGNMFEYDAFRVGAKIKKGIFVEIRHYSDTKTFQAISPSEKIGMIKKWIISPLMRYLLVRLSITFKYDISSVLQRAVYSQRSEK